MKAYQFVLVAFLLILSACAQNTRPNPARCRVNADCAAGKVCVNTWCDNMYWPLTEERLYGEEKHRKTK